MSLTLSPKKNPPRTIDQFIDAAPDAGAGDSLPEAKVPGFKQGNKQQISLTMDADLLREVEVRRKELGMSRAAYINMATRNMVENGVSLPGRKG